MARIGIDCRFSGGVSGLGRFTRELVGEMVRVASEHQWYLFVRDIHEDWLRQLPSFVTVVRAPYSHYSLAEQLLFPFLVHRRHLDLFFAPHFNVPFLLMRHPFVCVIHDTILHRSISRIPSLQFIVYRIVFWFAIRNAQRIVAVSHAVAGEIGMAYGNCVAGRVRVIREGVTSFYCPVLEKRGKEVRMRYGISCPYFLYVGTTKRHKNLPFLLRAFAQLGNHDARALILITDSDLSFSLPPGVHVLHQVSEEDLPSFYSGADAFVTASLAEGFCLPAAEALACGCPVIGVRIPALEEMVKDGGTLVAPEIDTLVEALYSCPSRERQKRKPSFSRGWRDVSLEMNKVLSDVLL